MTEAFVLVVAAALLAVSMLGLESAGKIHRGPPRRPRPPMPPGLSPLPHPDPNLMAWHPRAYPSDREQARLRRKAWDETLTSCGRCPLCLRELARRMDS